MADQVPTASRELLDYLSRLFPDRCPDVATPERKLWMDVGAAMVVRKLRSDYDRYTKSILEK
jgi:hypothetical protein